MHKQAYAIHKKPSRNFILLTFAAFTVTVALVFAASSWDLDTTMTISSLLSKDSSCLLALSNGRWELATEGCSPPQKGILSSCDNIHTDYPRQWVWNLLEHKSTHCVPDMLVHKEVSGLLRNKRVALVGDSHLRKLFNYLGEFLEDENISEAPTRDKKEHKDFIWNVKKTKTTIEFYWRAEIRSAASLLREFLENHQAPDLLVMDPSAHQAKWARNFTEFQGEIPRLMEAIHQYHREFGRKKTMFWLISPPFKEPFVKNDEMVTWMYSLKKFNSVLIEAGFLAPKGPVYPIDLYSMAQGCMDWCYRDGTHVVETFNTLLWQILTGAYRYILTS